MGGLVLGRLVRHMRQPNEERYPIVHESESLLLWGLMLRHHDDDVFAEHLLPYDSGV